MKILLFFTINICFIFTSKSETKTTSKTKNLNANINDKNIPKAGKSIMLKRPHNENIIIKESKKHTILLDDKKNLNNHLNNTTDINFKKISFLKFFEATGTIIIAGSFDRSFFITTLMAIKYSKTIVLFSASASLTFIGIIAVYAGFTINKYVPLIWVESIAIFLFLTFGFHMIYDAITMEAHSLKEQLEKETTIHNNEDDRNIKIPIEENLQNNKKNEESKFINNQKGRIDVKTNYKQEENCYNLNENSVLVKEDLNKEITEENKDINENEIKNNKPEKTNLFSKHILNNESIKVFSKVFILIFFSEIGDRSQVSTIYLTTSFDKLVVLLGVVFSSIILSILAVFGGKIISDKISEKNLTLIAGISFLLFGIGALGMIIYEKEKI